MEEIVQMSNSKVKQKVVQASNSVNSWDSAISAAELQIQRRERKPKPRPES